MRKKIIIGVLSLIVVTLLFILYLISPLGLGTCLSILDNFTPGSLHYKTATGSILGPIKLSQASYNNKNYSVHAKSIDFDWSLQDIFNHEIKLSYIKGNDITININYNPNDSSKGLLDQTTSVELTKPKKNKYIISIGPAKIDQLTLWINNHRLLELHNIRTTKTVSSDKLDLELISELYEPIKTKIKIHLKGLINRYLFNTTFKNSNSNWSLSGSGDMASVNIKTLHTKLLNGELNGNGTLDWIKKKWKINIKGTKLDLKTINLHLPKAISIAFQGSGSMQSPNQMQYQLSGTLSNKNNHIQFKAHKDKLLNVSWDANLKQLESLSDELTGKLNSKGFITYKGINSDSNGFMTISKLGYQQTHINDADCDWNLKKLSGAVQCHAKEINNENASIKKLSTVIKGNIEKHNIKLSSIINNNQVSMYVKGSRNNRIFSEVINSFKIKSSNANLTNKEPITVVADKNHLKIPHSCLNDRNKTLCISATLDKKKWKATLNTTQIPLSLLLPFKQKNLSLSNLKTNTEASINGDSTIVNHFNITSVIPSGDFYYIFNGIPYEIRFDKILLQSTLNNHLLKGKVKVLLGKDNDIGANISIKKFNQNQIFNKNSLISGSAKVLIPNLKRYNNLIPQSLISKGSLKANIKLSGSTLKPKIIASAELKDGNIRFPLIGLEINAINLKLKDQDNVLTTSSSINIHNKTLTLDSKTNLVQKGVPTQASLSGENILITNTPKIKLYVTPNLRFTHRNNNSILSGGIDFSKSYLDLSIFHQASQLPYSDISYVNSKQDLKNKLWNTLTLNIGVNLLDDNLLTGYGLKSNIYGEFQLYHTNHKPFTASGLMHLNNGSFAAYGHTLKIDPKSNIFYTGSNTPINNPQLNIEASKKISGDSGIDNTNEFEIHIGITGSLKNKIIQLSSSPEALTQSQILSLLLFGYTYSNDENNPLLLKAIGALQIAESGIQSSGGVANALRHSLGLNEIGINQNTNIDAIGNQLQGNSSQFIIGKYINKHTYLRYLRDVSNIDPAQELQLKFILNNKFSIRIYERFTQLSTSQGVDLQYSKSKK